MSPPQNPSSRPKLQMTHPMYPRIMIPAARVIGIGRQPALPANQLKPGDKLVLDYGEVYSLQKMVAIPLRKFRLDMVSKGGKYTHRTVPLNAHVAVSWGTFNKRWTVPKTGGNTMAKTGRKVNLTGNNKLDLKTPIKTGVSFQGTVDLTKQGGPKKGKKIDLNRY